MVDIEKKLKRDNRTLKNETKNIDKIRTRKNLAIKMPQKRF